MFLLLKVKFHNPSIFRRILFWLIITSIILFGAFYVYFKNNAGLLMEQRLTEVMGRQFRVGAVDLKLPLTIVMQNVEIVGILRSPQVLVSLEAPFYRQNQIVISELRLIEPILKIKRNSSGQIMVGEALELSAGEGQRSLAQNQGALSRPKISRCFDKTIAFKNISVERGDLIFIDYLSGNAMPYKIRELNLNLFNATYPLGPNAVEFNLRGDFPRQNMPFSESRFAGRGWVNLSRKDLDAQFSCSRQDGALLLSANLNSQNNDVRVRGRIQIDQAKNPRIIDTLKGTSLGTFVISIIQSVNLQADVNFSFKTRLEDFKIDNVALSGQIGYAAINNQSLLSQAPNLNRQQAVRPLMQMQK